MGLGGLIKVVWRVAERVWWRVERGNRFDIGDGEREMQGEVLDRELDQVFYLCKEAYEKEKALGNVGGGDDDAAEVEKCHGEAV